jgi:hypothetical protein
MEKPLTPEETTIALNHNALVNIRKTEVYADLSRLVGGAVEMDHVVRAKNRAVAADASGVQCRSVELKSRQLPYG